MNKLTTREKRLGIKLLIDEDSSTILLKEVVDRINLEKKRGDKGFIRHEKAMSKVESLMALNSSFGQCPKIGHCYFKNKGASQNIETYVLNRKQAITTAASLNDKILLWVMDRFEEMMMIIKEDNKALQDFNTQRLSVVDTNKNMTKALMEFTIESTGEKPHFSKYIAENKEIFKLSFGITPSEYKKIHNLSKKETPRNNLTSDELALLMKLETTNTDMITMGFSRTERLTKLRKIKISFLRNKNKGSN